MLSKPFGGIAPGAAADLEPGMKHACLPWSANADPQYVTREEGLQVPP